MNKEEAIRNLSKHPDATLRRMAAEKLCADNNPGELIINALANGLHDEDSGVKDICYQGLISFSDDLSKIVAQKIAPNIISKNIEIRNLVGDILIRLGKSATEQVAEYLSHKDAEHRQFAVDILGRIGYCSPDINISALLDDPDPNVRVSAVEALGNIRAISEVNTLINLYEHNEELQPIIIESLGKIGDEQAQQFLFNMLKNEKDEFLLSAVVDSLAFIGTDPEISHRLLELLPNINSGLHGTILKTSFAIAFRQKLDLELPAELRHIAVRAIFDEDEDIRDAGLIALGNQYFAEDIPALVHIVLQNITELQQLILNNLLCNSDQKVLEDFILDYARSCKQDEFHIEFFSYLPIMWNDAPDNNKSAAINVLLELLISGRTYLSPDLFELLISFARKQVVQFNKTLLAGEDKEKIRNMLELMSGSDIEELAAEIIVVKEKYPEIAEY